MGAECFNCKSKFGLHTKPRLPHIAQKWLNVIPNMATKTEFPRTFKLCSAHFDLKYLTFTGRLTQNAVPSKFINESGVWYEILTEEDILHESNPSYKRLNAALTTPIIRIHYHNSNGIDDQITPQTGQVNIFKIPQLKSSYDLVPSSTATRCLPQICEKYQMPVLRNPNQFRFVTEVTRKIDNSESERQTRNSLKLFQLETLKLRKDKKLLQQKIDRMYKKIENLKNLVEELKKNSIYL